MKQENPLIGLDGILRQRFSRRDAMRAAALAPFALSEKNKFKDKLRESSVRSDLADLLVSQESLESAVINISHVTDATEENGTVISKYVINNGILCSSHWDEQKRRYTKFKPLTDLFSGLIGLTFAGVNIVPMPDNKTLIAPGYYPDENGLVRSFIAVSEDRGENFGLLKLPAELEGEVMFNQASLIEDTPEVLIRHITQDRSDQYLLFNYQTYNLETLRLETLREKNGMRVPSMHGLYLSPDKSELIVDGSIGISHGGVTTIAEAHIDLINKELERVTYTELPVDYSSDIHFYRDKNGNLTQIYTTNYIYSGYLDDDQFKKSGMYIFDNQTKVIDTIPFGTFRDPVKELLGDEWSEVGLTQFQRIGNMNVAAGSAVNDPPDSYFTNNKALTVFWPEGSDPRDPSNLTFRYIDTEESTLVYEAGLKRLKSGFIFEEIIAGLGLAAMPITQDGRLLGEEVLFPNDGLQIEKLLTNSS